jgi:hypothetical protein
MSMLSFSFSSHKLPMTPLSQKVEQTLLVDLETTDQISLVDICDAKEGIYGAPGKSQRPVQLRFQKIKELSAHGYRKLLVKHNITPGPPATLAAAQREQAQELPEQATTQDADKYTAQDASEELVLSDEEEEELVLSDDDTDIDKHIDTDLTGRISIKSKSSKMFPPEKTPIKKSLFSPASGVSPGHYSSTDMMASLTEVHASYYEDTDPAVDALDFRQQCGTNGRPYIILADPSHPSRAFLLILLPWKGLSTTTTTTTGSMSGWPPPCPT